MKVRYIKSATVSVETNGVIILTDPWLTDGEYYGSWYHYPPLEFDASFFENIDYIYVSHIHPDHFSKSTFQKFNTNIPVLIHSYDSKFLKNNIERLGFTVVELPHNTRTHLKNGVYINILAADNCNPESCAKFLGCGIVEVKYGSTQIDTLCVIDDGKFTVVNTNDCPFDLSRETLELINQQYRTIDLLLVGYAGAGPYPQCFHLDETEKQKAADRKRIQFLDYGVKFIHKLNPKVVLPFAGTYVLGGKLAKLQKYRGVPEIEDGAAYFSKNTSAKVILLNSYEYYDLETKTSSKPYIPTNLVEKENYIQKTLSKHLLDYEKIDGQDYINRHREEIFSLIGNAYNRFENKRKEIGFNSETKTLIFLDTDLWCKISNNGEGFSFVNDDEKNRIEKFVSYKLDIRLLHKILKGPRFAHWNNAEIGSHIEYERKPNIFERGLHYSMNFFHG
ncbi:MBL fold metallo-hydrolase [Fulvivirgaceae bacterium LMO-SS25]